MKLNALFFLIFSAIPSGCSLLNHDIVSPYKNYSENGLSVFYIHPKPISKDFYSPVTLIYKGETYNAEGKIRGGQTALYPKKSYTLKFPDEKLFSDPDNTDFQNKHKIALLSNFDDNSHMRNRLAYFMWDQLNNSFTINTASSVVYTNGAFEGLYTVVDFIDEDFIERNNIVNGIATGGELFKGVTNEVDFFMKSDLVSGFEKKTGLPEAGDKGAYDTLKAFITTVNTVSDADFAVEFEKIANVKSYYNWWFFTSFMRASDSIGKNSYHYRDPLTDKWHYIPWDFNNSFGQDWNTKRIESKYALTYVSKNGIFERLVPDPVFSAFYQIEYTAALQNELQLSILLDKVDQLYAEIELAAEADYKKWGEIYRDFHVWDDRDDFTSFGEEVQYIKDWITAQHAAFDIVY